MGYGSLCCKETDTTELLTLSLSCAYHSVCLRVFIKSGHLFLFPLSFTESILHLPALVGKDCSSSMGIDDEDKRAYQKTSSDE